MPRNSRGNNNTNSANYWPGFVDVMATLLLVIIFILTVFILSQFYLSTEISSKDDELQDLNIELTDKDNTLADLTNQLMELTNMLALEEAKNQDLTFNIQTLETEVNNISLLNRTIMGELETAKSNIVILRDEIDNKNIEFSEAQDNIILLQEEVDILQNKVVESEEIYDQKRDELAKKRAEMIKLIAENNRIKKILNIKNIEINTKKVLIDNKNEKIVVLEDETLALKDNLSQNELTILDLRNIESENNQDNLFNIESINSLEKINNQNNQTIIDLRAESEEQQQIILDLRRKEQILRSGLTSTANENIKQQDQVKILNLQLDELKKQLASISTLLDESEKRDLEQKARIADLGSRLNTALAQRVKELSEYRSEFFGKLKEVIGSRDDIKIIGDRFVFQSEVLFESGEANIGIEGQRQLAKLSVAIQDLIDQIPTEINWILRIDGHTDTIPIRNSRFQSNWELSAARAISVVEFLTRTGIPANRLAATGRGEFMPLDTGKSEEAYKKNRRIEIKLTES